MLHFTKLFILLFAIIVLTGSCNTPESREASATLIESKVNKNDESFEAFNKRFHSDSAFQLSRIAFPIRGKQIGALEKREWKVQNWILMKVPIGAPVDTLEYKYSLRVSDSTVNESYWIEESDFYIERAFERKKGKWFLIYYNDINM